MVQIVNKNIWGDSYLTPAGGSKAFSLIWSRSSIWDISRLSMRRTQEQVVSHVLVKGVLVWVGIKMQVQEPKKHKRCSSSDTFSENLPRQSWYLNSSPQAWHLKRSNHTHSYSHLWAVYLTWQTPAQTQGEHSLRKARLGLKWVFLLLSALPEWLTFLVKNTLNWNPNTLHLGAKLWLAPSLSEWMRPIQRCNQEMFH